MRYVFTQYLFGGEVFPPALMDARLDPMLRALGLTPEPAIAERSWRTPLPVFRAATADRSAFYEVTLPAGMWPRAGASLELPNNTDAAEVNMVTKVTKVFTGDIPARPWPSVVCSIAPSFARLCSGATGSPGSALLTFTQAALNGPGDELASRYGFFSFGEAGSAPLVEAPASSSGGLLVLLAVAGGYAYYATRSSPLRGLGRLPKSIKTGRLRKLAQRRRHEGRYMEARRLEQRANRLSRST